MCCYFDDIIKFKYFDFDNVLTDGKSCENILMYNISYITLISPKQLHIRFNKIDGLIRVYGGTTYLVLFGPVKYDTIYNRIKNFISHKSDITYVISHHYARIKVDSYDSLPREKTLTLHVIILSNSVFNKNQKHYYYNIFV